MRRYRLIGALGTAFLVVGSAPAFASGSCVAGFGAIGEASGIGPAVEIPARNQTGVPYAGTQLLPAPQAHALAGTAYEGFVAAILLQSSGAPYHNPTLTESYWPAPQGGTSTNELDFGPAGHVFTSGARGPHAIAWSRASGQQIASGVSVGSIYTVSEAYLLDGVIHARDEAWMYDLDFSGLHIGLMDSVVEAQSAGTPETTSGSWKTVLLDVSQAGSDVLLVSPDGITVQGGTSIPWSSTATQLADAETQLAAASWKAGIGNLWIRLVPGSAQRRDTNVNIVGADLVVRIEPQRTEGGTGSAVDVTFSRVAQSLFMGLETCYGFGGGIGGVGVPPTTLPGQILPVSVRTPAPQMRAAPAAQPLAAPAIATVPIRSPSTSQAAIGQEYAHAVSAIRDTYVWAVLLMVVGSLVLVAIRLEFPMKLARRLGFVWSHR